MAMTPETFTFSQVLPMVQHLQHFSRYYTTLYHAANQATPQQINQAHTYTQTVRSLLDRLQPLTQEFAHHAQAVHDYFARRHPTAQEFGQFTQATIDFSTAMADEVGNAAQSIAPVALADVIQQMQQHAAYGRRAGAIEVLLQVTATYMAWPGVHPLRLVHEAARRIFPELQPLEGSPQDPQHPAFAAQAAPAAAPDNPLARLLNMTSGLRGQRSLSQPPPAKQPRTATPEAPQPRAQQPGVRSIIKDQPTAQPAAQKQAPTPVGESTDD
jgi:hypothetical protein